MSTPVAGPVRRMPVGAEPTSTGTHFRVWAPTHDTVSVVIRESDGGERVVRCQREDDDGYCSNHIEGVSAGARYGYRLGNDETCYPDPASRWQPDGPHGLSAVVDASTFRWTDGGWMGLPPNRHVFYELHVGTFTPEGTWEAAAARLPMLAEIGLTTIEMMPVAEFAGQFGWGYDGVSFFAPYHRYGTPDDLRAFVDRAHALGMAVILDVVYNHVGPDGWYGSSFSGSYLSGRYKTDWGSPPNFDDVHCGPVREFCTSNARYWIDEFHFDGLRLDATQNIEDASPRHVLAEIGEAVRAAGGTRRTFIVAENEPQHTTLVRPIVEGGYGLDALWNDDFHHSAVVAATGRSEAYYSDHRGRATEFVAAAKFGYLFQGQRYAWQRKARGTPGLDLSPQQFVHFLENHDQIANSGRGQRLYQQTDPATWRALTALLLLGPQLPLLFQGEEFGSTRPFLFFADHAGELGANVRLGRREFLAQFPSLSAPSARAVLADPASPDTFASCVLDWHERETNAETLALHRDLLALRRNDRVLLGDARIRVDGAPLNDAAFVLRYFTAPATGDRADDAATRGGGSTEDVRDRLLIVNLGPQVEAGSFPEPLTAPPLGCEWQTRWSSEAPAYGGNGAPAVLSEDGWFLAAHSATLLAAWPSTEDTAK